ncbi:hypothetical protein ACFOSD_14525 [Salinispirillum marinum]|uniref:Uncharacterized protein n=2 Tax=Saccharospirillaceae TaxID=255527 RepID=A0ABV8BJZ7_9GAMM
MLGEYKKFVATPSKDEGTEITVFCHSKAFAERRGEVEGWIDVLMKSEGATSYDVEISDSTWTEATINRDRLFEEHFGNT